MRSLFIISLALFTLYACEPKQSTSVAPQEGFQPYIKSVMLYDTIQRWPIDTIMAALDDINKVISMIESREAGYSLWKVQDDTIPDYRYLIQGHWPDQESFDSIHVNPDFRKALDDNVHIFTETRKWELYRRYQLVE